MAIISASHNFICLHIPKTAGTSVRTMLSQYQSNKPESPAEWHEDMVVTRTRVSQTFFDNAFKFTFIRNPWDRMYSSYQFICHKKLNTIENIPQEYYKEIGFKRWLMEESFYVPNHIAPTPDMIPIQRKTLSSWMCDESGNQLVDFVGRFENINEDFSRIIKHIGVPNVTLPKLAPSQRKKDYREAYDNESREFVEIHHKIDIDTFGYTFDND